MLASVMVVSKVQIFALILFARLFTALGQHPARAFTPALSREREMGQTHRSSGRDCHLRVRALFACAKNIHTMV